MYKQPQTTDGLTKLALELADTVVPSDYGQEAYDEALDAITIAISAAYNQGVEDAKK